MVSRPRSHQLEELSRRRFEGALPPHWVHRNHDPDYGIDETVEIFDEADHATGMAFYAQLKSTDAGSIDKALSSVRFRRDQVEYYQSLPLPLLVVLFHAPSDRLFARWFHAYNRHVALQSDDDLPAKTVRFDLSELDEWTETSSARLAAGVHAFNAFRSPEIALPIRFSFHIDDPPHGADTLNYVFALRAVLRPVEHIIDVEAGPRDSVSPAVSLSRTAVVVSLGDVASLTIDLDVDALKAPQTLAADIAVGIALVLARIGQANLASQIAGSTAAASRVILDWNAAFTLAGAMVRSRRVVEAMTLADALDARAHSGEGDEPARLAAHVIQTVALALGGSLNSSERESVIDVAMRVLQRAEHSGDDIASGAAAYNLAMLYKSAGDGEKAIHAFRKAAELDPAYLGRSYFHRDLAGAYFETGCYENAAAEYQESLGDCPDSNGPALYADALLFAGRYAEAGSEFARYCSDADASSDAEWRLKNRVIGRIRAVGGDVQVREVAKSEALIRRVDLTGGGEELSLDEAREILNRALAFDACAAEAWFRLQFVEFAESEVPGDALDSALLAAVLHRHAPGAWVNALLMACMSGADEELILDILRVAYKFKASEFVEELAAAKVSNEVFEVVLPMLDSVMSDASESARGEGFVLRFPDESGVMEEIEFVP